MKAFQSTQKVDGKLRGFLFGAAETLRNSCDFTGKILFVETPLLLYLCELQI